LRVYWRRLQGTSSCGTSWYRNRFHSMRFYFDRDSEFFLGWCHSVNSEALKALMSAAAAWFQEDPRFSSWRRAITATFHDAGPLFHERAPPRGADGAARCSYDRCCAETGNRSVAVHGCTGPAAPRPELDPSHDADSRPAMAWVRMRPIARWAIRSSSSPRGTGSGPRAARACASPRGATCRGRPQQATAPWDGDRGAAARTPRHRRRSSGRAHEPGRVRWDAWEGGVRHLRKVGGGGAASEVSRQHCTLRSGWGRRRGGVREGQRAKESVSFHDIGRWRLGGVHAWWRNTPSTVK
jgi:hypothetical protein